MGLDHLLQTRLVAHDHIIGQDYREGFIMQTAARAPDRMAEPERRMLADHRHAAIGDRAVAHGLQQVMLLLLLVRRLALEASGGVTLETIGAIARTGVERISVGSLTHHAVSLDLGLDIEPVAS